MTEAITVEQQINRVALHWLLATQVVLVIPHLEGLPLWLFAICGVCGGWRYLIFSQVLAYPSSFIRSLIVILGFASVAVEYLGKFSLDPAVALLVLAFYLKILETKSKRDVYVVVCLGFFVAATRLLYSQSIYATLYALFCCMLLLVTLLSLHQTESTDYQSAFKRAGVLMVKAVPLLIILFLFFPRVPPLWSVPLPAGQGITGVNDKLSPGAMTRLAKSDATAFRVEFSGKMPAPSEQYWRGLVFDTFDGKEWRETKARTIADDKREFDTTKPDYILTTQPSYQHWLFTLSDSHIKGSGVVRRSNGTLASYEPLKKRRKFLVNRLQAPTYQVLSEQGLQRNTQLPNSGNPRSRQLASQLRQENPNNENLARAVLTYFNQNNYFYTLQTTKLGKDSIDEFLFDTQQGYCEHYATAFVYLMRAAGVPARAVGGYLGGEPNPFDDYIRVRELDAHAWAEIWIKDKGWVRIDPTAAVAPERILNGVEDALRARNEFNPTGLSGWSNASGLLWINMARLWLDSINHEWTRTFLNYDKQKQSAWLKSWWGESSTDELLRVLVMAVLLLLFAFFIWTVVVNKWWGTKLFTLLEVFYCRIVSSKGIDVVPSDTIKQLTQRVVNVYPKIAAPAQNYCQWHENYIYKENNELSYWPAMKSLLDLRVGLLFTKNNNVLGEE